MNVLAFSNRITTNFFSNLWCKFLCFSTAFQNGSACKFLCPATLHFSDKSVHKFLDVLAFSNRITANFFSNLWCKLPCFFNCDSKEKCVQIFVPCNVELFQQECSQVFERVTSCNRITANFVSKLWRKLRCFSTAFQKGSAGKFLCPATLHFSYKRARKFFERACFQQPYYDKRCCEICYLLPKIGNFTKKIAKKYLKPLTVFGD